MAANVANLVFKLGALGARKLGEHEECIVVLRFGLSFVFPDVLVDSLFGMLPMQLEEQMADIGRKLDLLLGEAQLTSMQLLRDAFIAFDTGNYGGACKLFHEVRKNATRAFNQADSIEAWVSTTQLKITAAFLTKSFESDRMVLFTDLTANRRLEIARTIKGYIDDLIAKADSLKKDTVEKVKRASFQQKARTKEAKERLKGIDDKVNPVLRATYPVLSHGLALTDPNKRIRAFSSDEFSFDVLPKYIPEGKLNHVSVMVAKKPELIIEMHRRLDFTYDTLDLIDGQVLTWTLNDVSHQLLYKGESSVEPLTITVTRPELETVFRGGAEAKSRRITLGTPNAPSTGDLQLPMAPAKAPPEDSVVVRTKTKLNGSAARVDSPQDCPVCQKPVSDVAGGWIHPKCSKCAECGDALDAADLALANGEGPRCKLHRQQKEACAGCDKRIEGRRLRARGRLFHPACLACAVCGEHLDKDTGFYERDGKLVCQKEVPGKERDDRKSKTRMKCEECHEDITGTYFVHQGKNICEKDYEKFRKKCDICGENITGSYYTGKDNKIICEKDYKKQQGGSLDCFKCKKEVKGEIVRALDVMFHPECFRCLTCGTPLSGATSFNADEEKRVYCRQHYIEKFSPKCCKCNFPIAPKAGEKTASRLRMFDKDWHPDCFKCEDCGSRLGGDDGKKCFPRDNTPLCLDCCKNRD